MQALMSFKLSNIAGK